MRGRIPDGRTIETRVSAMPGGGVVLVFRDVTEVADREAKLAEVQRDIVMRQEAERGRIARELHDSLGQYLAAINMKIGMLTQEATAATPVGAGLADLRGLTEAAAERGQPPRVGAAPDRARRHRARGRPAASGGRMGATVGVAFRPSPRDRGPPVAATRSRRRSTGPCRRRSPTSSSTPKPRRVGRDPEDVSEATWSWWSRTTGSASSPRAPTGPRRARLGLARHAGRGSRPSAAWWRSSSNRGRGTTLIVRAPLGRSLSH